MTAERGVVKRLSRALQDPRLAGRQLAAPLLARRETASGRLPSARSGCGWAAPTLLIPRGSEPRVKAARRVRVSRLLRRGLPATATTSDPAELSVKLLARSRVIDRRSARLKAAASRALRCEEHHS